MAVIEQAIWYHLTTSGQSSTAALVNYERVYPYKLPQRPELPAISYRRVTGRDVMAHDGPIGLPKGRYQFDCYAGTYAQAKNLAKTLRDDLDGFSGAMGQAGDQVTLGHIFWLGEVDDWGDAAEIWRVAVDFEIQWCE